MQPHPLYTITDLRNLLRNDRANENTFEAVDRIEI